MPKLDNSRHEAFYVYALFDPLTRRVFYIGKGKGRRAWQHEVDERRGTIVNPAKCEILARLRVAQRSPKVRLLRSGLTEAEAYRLERRWIVRFHNRLTNILSGTITEIERAQAEARRGLHNLRPFCQWVKAWPDIYSGSRRFMPVNRRLEVRTEIVKGLHEIASQPL